MQDMSEETSTACALPGVELVRISNDLTQRDLALRVRALGGKMQESTVSSVETGARGTSLRNVGFMAQVMCCRTDDLFGRPGPARLAAIRADFLQGEADRAREEARAAS